MQFKFTLNRLVPPATQYRISTVTADIEGKQYLYKLIHTINYSSDEYLMGILLTGLFNKITNEILLTQKTPLDK